MALSQIAFDFGMDEAASQEPVLKKTVPKKSKTTTTVEVIDLQPPVKKSTRGRKSLQLANSGIDLIDIPEDEILFSKLYYSIGDVAGMFKVNASLIRLWENEFDVLKPRKNRKGDRLFRPEDVKNLKLIYHLLRERKFSMQGAKDFIKKSKKVDEKFEMIENLKRLKGFLHELKAGL